MSSSGRRAVTAVVIGLILIVAGALGGYVGASGAKTTYRSTATVVVIPPGAGSPNALVNPFVNLDTKMSQLALVMTTAINSPEPQHQFTTPASVTNVEASVVPDSSRQNANNTSEIALTVDGTDPEDTRTTADQLIRYSSDRLTELQTHAGVQNSALASQQVVVFPSTGQVAKSSAIRAIAVSALIGVAIAATLIVLILGTFRWWRTATARGRHGRSADIDDWDRTADGSAHRDHEPVTT